MLFASTAQCLSATWATLSRTAAMLKGKVYALRARCWPTTHCLAHAGKDEGPKLAFAAVAFKRRAELQFYCTGGLCVGIGPMHLPPHSPWSALSFPPHPPLTCPGWGMRPMPCSFSSATETLAMRWASVTGCRHRGGSQDAPLPSSVALPAHTCRRAQEDKCDCCRFPLHLTVLHVAH